MSNSIRSYKFPTSTYYETTASKLEEIVNEYFNLKPGYNILDGEMWYREHGRILTIDIVTHHHFPGEADYIIRSLKKGYSPYGLRTILNQMAIEGAIPAGKYMVKVDK